MKKLLLLIEDYSERTYIEKVLSRVGWDLEVAQGETGISELILRFQPNFILASAGGSKIKGENLATKYRSLQNKPVLLLLAAKNYKPVNTSLEGVTKILVSPVQMPILLQVLEKHGGLSEAESLKKLSSHKKTSARDDDTVWVKDAVDESVTKSNKEDSLKDRLAQKRSSLKINDDSLKDRYSKFVNENPMEKSEFDGIDPTYVESQTTEFRKMEDDPDITDIDEERKKMAVAMFKTAQKK
ncbi:MAG: hypothetical protein AB8E15_05235 [Bdellovibrionales bacterium]